ncbi:hypothetical protein ABZ770_23755 [Streptomyces sp. NPDC006654]|uniref:hypothetical protein n=1 Tax=Streptomyces sp. NPDC006654 TaxID=3156897 RepID=UPI0033D99076
MGEQVAGQAHAECAGARYPRSTHRPPLTGPHKQLTHLACYAGWPNAMSAMTQLKAIDKARQSG